MKQLFHLIILCFFLTLTLLLLPNELQAQPIESIDFIQSAEKETVVLISNNLLGGEIYSNKDDKSTNFSGNSPFLIAFNSKENLFDKNKIQINKKFIYNLSVNKQNINQIRAP